MENIQNTVRLLDRSMNNIQNLKKLSDEELYSLCVEYGQKALHWRYRFAGLLPEANERKLYLKKGFSSIFEFAAKLAGISQEQVRRVLNMDKRFDDKPKLQALLRDGKVSVNKLSKITAMASIENEELLADQVQLLSTRSLETLARDERLLQRSVHVNTSSQGNEINVKTRNRSEEAENQELHLTSEAKQKLLEMQRKGIDISEFILESIQKREEEIEQEKQEISMLETDPEEVLDSAFDEVRAILCRMAFGKKVTRYIAAKTRKLLKKEHGTKCSVPHCNKPAVEIHHSNLFSLSKIHDPRFMAPLCREHHQIAHTINQKYQEKREEAVAILC